ncbi:MAG: ABC-2 family transporter protein [Clostridiales bacterium]|nr:ABC-2 family transporter protein [Clostridiales bacterium]
MNDSFSIKRNKYWVSLSMGFVNSMEYRFDFLISLLSTTFPIIIQVFVWTAIYDASTKEVLYGHTFPQMMVYTVFAGAISMFIRTGVEQSINRDIHSGQLSNFLVKSIMYIPFRIMNSIGEKLSSIVVMILFSVIASIAMYVFIGFEMQVINIILFLPAIVLAFLLNFFIFFCISTLAFWITEASRFFYSITIIVMVASGGVFPIDIFGTLYVKVLKLMPFMYTTTFPIKVINGTLSSGEILNGFLVQIIWIVVFSFFATFLWKKGSKRFVAVGG